MKYHRHFNPARTPQSEEIPASEQVPNSAGGYAWELSGWERLDRFLMLGTEDGTFYVGERKLTVENATNVVKLLKSDGARVVQRLVEISEGGKAHKNDPALFALALAFSVGDDATRREAGLALPRVARTGTHLFTFLEYVGTMRGWGRGLRQAVAGWYEEMPLERLIYQVTKYRQRGGWSHRDALRLSHPKSAEASRDALYAYVVSGAESEKARRLIGENSYLRAVEAASGSENPDEVAALIREFGLPREVVPTELLRHSEIWEALLERMPLAAMIRNLGNMTRVGLLKPMSEHAARVAQSITDRERLRRARVHPIQILAALATYSSGAGVRGGNSWEPVSEIVAALDRAFYLSFENVESSGKRIVFGLDVSGSMDFGSVSGVPGLTPRVATGALALVNAVTEEKSAFVAFSHELIPVNISPEQRLDDVLRRLDEIPFGGTDCALPILWASENGIEADAFVILTDSETWAGKIHPSQALLHYRRKSGIPAKMVVVGMTSNAFTIADPNDAGMLDVVGLSTDTPNLISHFVSQGYRSRI